MTGGRRWFLSRCALLGVWPAAARAAASTALEKRLLAALEGIDAVNTHEHIIPEPDRLAQTIDFFSLAGHYTINDVISAGLPAESVALVRKPEAPLAERWRAFEPFWKFARFTGYSQALRIAVRDLYGVEEISLATIPKINDALRQQSRPGLYRRVLKERARIRFSVVDDNWSEAPAKLDPEFFVLAHKFDRFITASTAQDVQRLEALTQVSITSLAGLKQAMEKMFQDALDAGMVTVKTTIAYSRELHFREVEAGEAAADFEALVRGERKAPEGFRRNLVRPLRNLEDHMFHHLVRLADARRVPMQIHTGLHAGNANFVQNSNPTHLTNLFFLYPRVKFDLFHISYPYQGELSVLAKLFPNVHIDFSWAHIVSPTASRRALHVFLETVPANKILGFGGDYRYPELTYGHAKMARQNIAQVLAEKTESRFCTENEAVELGRMLLDENPAKLFSPAARKEGA